MINQNILAPDRPVSNFWRRFQWRKRFELATGIRPSSERFEVIRCDVCRRPMWVPLSLAVECGRFECHRHGDRS